MDINDIMMFGLQIKKFREKRVEAIIRQYDLRPIELDILVILYKEKDIDTAKEIIHRNHLSKAHISKSLDNLRIKGYIQLNEDKNDHRILHISLTDKSKEVINKAIDVYRECKEIIVKNINSDELEIVKKAICKMSLNVNLELGE